MIHSMHITADNRPAMLERILQTARVRGFHIRGLEVHATENRDQFRITLTVESEKPDQRLIRQLEKITGLTTLTALHAIESEQPDQVRATA
ncbi:MAG: acetolactate synthase 2 small subunit [Candidatus Sedimenticola sp. 6PFRAG7]